MLTRDMYYRDPELFVKQAVVDRYVDDIAYTFGVERDALNVVGISFFWRLRRILTYKVAAAKGLVAGVFTVTRKDKSSMDYSQEAEVSPRSNNGKQS
jgi:meiotic recombination protein SPO11